MDHVHVDVTGHPDHACHERTVDELLNPAATGRTEYELCRLLAAGEGDQCFCRVLADDVVDYAAELCDQLALRPQRVAGLPGQPVVDHDVNGDQVAADASRHARRPTDQPLTPGAPGEPDHDALARLPRVLDPVRLQVAVQALLHAVGNPQQRQLA